MATEYDLYERNGIIYHILFDIDNDFQEAYQVSLQKSKKIQKILQKDTKKIFGLLNDITQTSHDITYMPSKVRKVYSDVMAEKQIQKVAFVGESLFLKTVITILARATNSLHKVKWFDSQEEALKWLKEE